MPRPVALGAALHAAFATGALELIAAIELRVVHRGRMEFGGMLVLMAFRLRKLQPGGDRDDLPLGVGPQIAS